MLCPNPHCRDGYVQIPVPGSRGWFCQRRAHARRLHAAAIRGLPRLRRVFRSLMLRGDDGGKRRRLNNHIKGEMAWHTNCGSGATGTSS